MDSLYIIVGNETLVKPFLTWRQVEKYKEHFEVCIDLGSLDEKKYKGIYIENFENLHEGEFEIVHPRVIFTDYSEPEAIIAAKACTLLWWRANYKFCPKCSGALTESEHEQALECKRCGLSYYPPIAPAIIVLITKGDEILLAHNVRFPAGRHGLIAGFVEAGENLEQAVKREVFEEVGVFVKNIKYISSQPWPTPNSLMLGFSAEWESGEIKADGAEIDHAAWFTNDNLPDLPPKGSIARRILEEYFYIF